MIEQSGIDAWFELDKAEFLGDDAAHYDKIIRYHGCVVGFRCILIFVF